MSLGDNMLRMNGTGGLQNLEVGGLNVEVFVQLLSNDNFGFGQLVVGADGQAANVTLVDRFDNGNRRGTPEALYLFGLGGADGLRILGGSTLYLNPEPNPPPNELIPTYALLGGQVVDLYSLFPAGVHKIAFDEGFLVDAVPLPSALVLALSSLSVLLGALRRRRVA